MKKPSELKECEEIHIVRNESRIRIIRDYSQLHMWVGSTNDDAGEYEIQIAIPGNDEDESIIDDFFDGIIVNNTGLQGFTIEYP